jgi:hypothetical protein
VPSLKISGAAADWDHRVDDDHWQQPGDLFRKMNPRQKQMLFDNTARQVGGAAKHIRERHTANVGNFQSAVAALGRRYRVFADLERKTGQFPFALWNSPNGKRDVVVASFRNDRKVKLPKQLHLCNVVASLLAKGGCLES